MYSADRSTNGGSSHAFGQVAEIALPTGRGAPRAARQVVDDCLSPLVAPPILDDARLLVSELVTNSVRHAGLGEDDAVLVRILLAAQALRLEIENPGTAGVIAAGSPDREAGRGFGLQLLEVLANRWGVSREQSTRVWFEMTRA